MPLRTWINRYVRDESMWWDDEPRRCVRNLRLRQLLDSEWELTPREWKRILANLTVDAPEFWWVRTRREQRLQELQLFADVVERGCEVGAPGAERAWWLFLDHYDRDPALLDRAFELLDVQLGRGGASREASALFGLTAARDERAAVLAGRYLARLSSEENRELARQIIATPVD